MSDDFEYRKLNNDDEIIATILTDLLQNGLKPSDISSEKFRVNSKYSVDEFDDAFDNIVQWLRDEGYVRYQTSVDGTEGETCFVGIVLTAKCLGALDVKLPSLGNLTGRQMLEKRKGKGISSELLVKSGTFIGAVFGGYQQSM
jgi:hypothetical protein